MAKTYVVFWGRVPGIYPSWDECKAQVLGFSKGYQRKYDTLEEAEQAWAAHLAQQEIERAKDKSEAQSLPLQELHNEEKPGRTSNLKRSRSDVDHRHSDYWKPSPKKQRIYDSDGSDGDAAPELEESNVETTLEQNAAVTMALEGHSIFLTGAAGCGKTVTLKEILREFTANRIEYQVVAPTGIAALPLSGKTTYSFLGWKPDSLRVPINKLKHASKKYVREAVRRLNVLIIEEISMVENQFLERMNHTFQSILENDRPFGGKQVIIVGDFKQLAPVRPFQFCLTCGVCMSKTPDIKCPKCRQAFEEGDQWAFKAPVWEALDLKYVHLNQIHRQKGKLLLEILYKIRNGVYLTNEEWDELEREKDIPKGLWAIRLMPKRDQVKALNNAKLEAIQDKPKTWKAVDSYEMKSGCGPAPTPNPWEVTDPLEEHRFEQSLTIKKGAKVVLLSNLDPHNHLVNGSQGTVVGFTSIYISKSSEKKADETVARRFFGTEPPRYPVVKFGNGKILPIRPIDSTAQYGTDQHPYLATRIQIPLMLAWALSIHKSQGMTLPHLEVSTKDMFARGQLYVALSRATDLEGLTVREGKREQLDIDSDVLLFYENTTWEDLSTTTEKHVPEVMDLTSYFTVDKAREGEGVEVEVDVFNTQKTSQTIRDEIPDSEEDGGSDIENFSPMMREIPDSDEDEDDL